MGEGAGMIRRQESSCHCAGFDLNSFFGGIMSSGLWSQFQFRCGQKAKNRIVMAPLTNMQSPTTELSDEEFRWLRLRIEGGYGIVTTCASHVVREAQSWPGELGIFEDRHQSGFQKLARVGVENDCFVVPQLFHGGFRAPQKLTGMQPVSASAFHLAIPDFEQPRALERREIEELVSDFTGAAKRAVSSGLNGVEVHGANGYLFTQFLSPATNHRRDEWGGSLLNRSRFLVETVKSIRGCLGSERILGVRLSPENTKLIPDLDFDEMLEVGQMLCESGIDYLSLSLWDALKLPDKYSSGSETVLEKYRRALPSEVGLIVAGKIWDLSQAQRAFDSGADFVALGTAAIANPEWPRLAQNPGFVPRRLPLSLAQLEQVGVSERFSRYLERWGFVLKGE